MTLDKFSPEVQQHLTTLKNALAAALDGNSFNDGAQARAKALIKDFVDALKLKSNLEPDFKVSCTVDSDDANKMIMDFSFRPSHMNNLTPEARQLVYMAGESEEVQIKRIDLYKNLEASRNTGQIEAFEIQKYDPETKEFNVNITFFPIAESITLGREVRLRIKDQE